MVVILITTAFVVGLDMKSIFGICNQFNHSLTMGIAFEICNWPWFELNACHGVIHWILLKFVVDLRLHWQGKMASAVSFQLIQVEGFRFVR